MALLVGARGRDPRGPRARPDSTDSLPVFYQFFLKMQQEPCLHFYLAQERVSTALGSDAGLEQGWPDGVLAAQSWVRPMPGCKRLP